MLSDSHMVRLELPSSFELLDLVQIVSDRMSSLAGMEEDAMHWVGVAVRESVINAIKHGNRQDVGKMVHVDFTTTEKPEHELTISVRDEGEGFEPEEIADPLAPENMLKSSGRGIFLMRNFMDDVVLRKVPEGGMEVKMVKRLAMADA